MTNFDSQVVPIDEIRVGQYVHLDLKWFEHPFAFGHFKIKTVAQIETIKSLGIKTVRINPLLSDAPAPELPPAGLCNTSNEVPMQGPSPESCDDGTNSMSHLLRSKRSMLEQMRARREHAAVIESSMLNTVKVIRAIEKDILVKPQEVVGRAKALVGEIADNILCAPELAIQVMGDGVGGEDPYSHALNVTMLSVMMARDLKMPVDVASTLGIGALMHDIGHKEVPDKILLKSDALTQAERNFFEMHCAFGAEMGHRFQLPTAAVTIIREHHECFDGTGYPSKLKGEQIHLLSRIVGIANYYDELCNPRASVAAMTPHETLSLMFSKIKSKFDPKLLQVLIHCLGVYPPGTIVQLSNGVMAKVVTVNTARPLRPTLMVYDAEVSKDEAILLDMERDSEFNIAKAIHPNNVSRDVRNYLCPSKRNNYYFDVSAARQESRAS